MIVSREVEEHLERLTAAVGALDLDAVERLGDCLLRACLDGRSVYVLGNGGSAATATHMAADAVRTGLRIRSLSENVSLLTALANDRGYEHVFVEQLRNLIGEGDVLVAVSASGDSPNVLRAMEYARERGAEVVGLLGFDGGEAGGLCDVAVVVPSRDYGIVEDVHLAVSHILVKYLRERLAGER